MWLDVASDGYEYYFKFLCLETQATSNLRVNDLEENDVEIGTNYFMDRYCGVRVLSFFINPSHINLILFVHRGALEPETEPALDIKTSTSIRFNNGSLPAETEEPRRCHGEIQEILGNIRGLMHNANYSDTPLQAYIVLMNDAHQVRTTTWNGWKWAFCSFLSA